MALRYFGDRTPGNVYYLDELLEVFREDDFTVIGEIAGFNKVADKLTLFIGGSEGNGGGHSVSLVCGCVLCLL